MPSHDAPLMGSEIRVPLSIDHFKRGVLLAIIALSLLSAVIAWEVMRTRGLRSPVLSDVLGTSAVVLLALLLVAWRRLPQRVLEASCLVFGVGISLPCLVHDIDAPYANFTLQLHFVSAVLIAALYFFSSYQHHLLLAQRAVDQLAYLSNTDDLTKLPDRRCMAVVIGPSLPVSPIMATGWR